jgi:imidazole glycerol-phosphate synthase subunit HisH
MTTVVIVDYGVGNLRSVARAIAHCGATPLLATRPEEVAAARIMILPGVGAFGSCVAALKGKGLAEPALGVIAAGFPVLGICVGMQMLLQESEEFGRHDGLGLIEGAVKAIPKTGADGTPHKIPHIGWNSLHPVGNGWDGTIFEDIQPGDCCYFVHSFAAQCARNDNNLAHCDYDGRTVCAAVHKDNLTGVQFHPEKSGLIGLKILNRFIAKA